MSESNLMVSENNGMVLEKFEANFSHLFVRIVKVDLLNKQVSVVGEPVLHPMFKLTTDLEQEGVRENG